MNTAAWVAESVLVLLLAGVPGGLGCGDPAVDTGAGADGTGGNDATAGNDTAGGFDTTGSDTPGGGDPGPIDCSGSVGASCFAGFLAPFFECFGQPSGDCIQQKLSANQVLACWSDGTRVSLTKVDSQHVQATFSGPGGVPCMGLDLVSTSDTTGIATFTIGSQSLSAASALDGSVSVTCPDGSHEQHDGPQWQQISACAGGDQVAPTLPSQCTPGLCVKR